MPDPSDRSEEVRPLIERLKSLLNRAPDDRAQLLDVLRKAHERDLIDADAVSMIEGVLQVSELSARDIMVPRSQMDVIDISQPFEQFLEHVIETAHSRFPVVEGDRDNVLGILHAKELLRLVASPDTDVRDLLRPPVFVPESKALNVLLRDFRANRNHLAVVVDEYGGVAGLVTIEDVLEQIVGDIEDEFDFDEESDHILAVERVPGDRRYRVRAITEIAQFNHVLGTQLDDDDFDTIGGLVTGKLGRVPRRGETVELAGLRFEVLRADARQVQLLLVTRIGNGEAAPEGAAS
ncbi:MAG: CBS domain-containing protein [Burkholderiaceae bacterium]|jgi:magnesium and cobalt transporter|nr:CBS domain-containing protein [Burkholderiaceae bacterium]MEB2318802.1 CBS domain-containing protein [Pseudomonadota bacterium]